MNILKPCIAFKTDQRINLNFCKIGRKHSFKETNWVKAGKVTIKCTKEFDEFEKELQK